MIRGAAAAGVFAWLAAACAAGSSSVAPTPDAGGGINLPAAVCDATSADSDGDFVSDACELHLARLFAPLLVVAPEGCNWDESVSPARLGGGYYFGVQRAESGAVRIAYLPAWYRDCGWSGAKCWLPLVSCDPHDGDSEAIVVDVRRGPADHWETEAVFLSAHCFDSNDDRCRWYKGAALSELAWVDSVRSGAPVVWVAEGRHANYPTRAACDRGHFHIDTCDANRLAYRFPIITGAQNIGSRAYPVGADGGCVDAQAAGWGSTRVDPGAIDCFWREDAAFRGWQPPSADRGATPYARYLEEIARF